jgi:hypothetical protein
LLRGLRHVSGEVPDEISVDIFDEVNFATIAKKNCYDIFGENSGEVSGETGLFVVELFFSTMKQKRVFFCFIVAFKGFR